MYKRPYDSRFPVVCMDESPRQLIDEVKIPIPCLPGQPARYDYEYKRCSTCNILMGNEPLAGTRMVDVTERKTKKDWVCQVVLWNGKCLMVEYGEINNLMDADGIGNFGIF